MAIINLRGARLGDLQRAARCSLVHADLTVTVRQASALMDEAGAFRYYRFSAGASEYVAWRRSRGYGQRTGAEMERSGWRPLRALYDAYGGHGSSTSSRDDLGFEQFNERWLAEENAAYRPVAIPDETAASVAWFWIELLGWSGMPRPHEHLANERWRDRAYLRNWWALPSGIDEVMQPGALRCNIATRFLMPSGRETVLEEGWIHTQTWHLQTIACDARDLQQIRLEY